MFSSDYSCFFLVLLDRLSSVFSFCDCFCETFVKYWTCFSSIDLFFLTRFREFVLPDCVCYHLSFIVLLTIHHHYKKVGSLDYERFTQMERKYHTLWIGDLAAKRWKKRSKERARKILQSHVTNRYFKQSL